MLLPVFALGRSQDMLALIDRYKRRGIIDEDVVRLNQAMLVFLGLARSPRSVP